MGRKKYGSHPQAKKKPDSRASRKAGVQKQRAQADGREKTREEELALLERQIRAKAEADVAREAVEKETVRTERMHYKVKAICAMFLAVVILFSLSAATVSWFSLNRQVNNRTEIGLDGSAVLATTFTAYKYNEEDGHAEAIRGLPIYLPLYDTVFIERNVNNTVVFRIPLFGTAINERDPISVALSLQENEKTTNHNYYNGTLDEKVPENAIANLLSNMIFLRCAVIDNELLQAAEIVPPETYTGDYAVENYVYDTIHAYFEDTNNSFVTSTFFDADDAKTDRITFTVSDYADAMETDAQVLYVYLEMGYDVERVNAMVAAQSMSLAFDDNAIPIPSDLDDFIFGIAG